MSSTPPFDTHRLVKQLRTSGLTEEQAELFVDTLSSVSLAMHDANQSALTTTYRNDLSALTSAYRNDMSALTSTYRNDQNALRLSVDGKMQSIEATQSEKLFNASLKADLQAKHWRETVQHEHAASKAEVRAEQQHHNALAHAEVQQRLAAFEKRMTEHEGNVRADFERLENRSVRLLITTVLTGAAVVLGALRLFK